MPENMSALLLDTDKQSMYFLHCYRILLTYFSTMQNIIWHVQVPFLARLASIFKKNLGGAIITHVHIIPWKGNYTFDEVKFNKIYASYADGCINDLGKDRFEEYAYNVSDLVICVTKSGKKHIMDTYSPRTDRSLAYLSSQLCGRWSARWTGHSPCCFVSVWGRWQDNIRDSR